MANYVDMKFTVGEALIQPFQIYDAAGTTIENIGGWTIQWYMQQYPDPESTIWPDLLSLPATITDAVNGLCQVSFLNVNTANLAPRTYWYELWRTDPGTEASLVKGNLFLLG